MIPYDRKLLVDAKLDPEIIAKIADVLETWGVDRLFVRCSYCHKPCINPQVRKRQFRRKSPPAKLFLRFELGYPDFNEEYICWPCDEYRFH